jgi:micrococcal nuclease
MKAKLSKYHWPIVVWCLLLFICWAPACSAHALPATTAPSLLPDLKSAIFSKEKTTVACSEGNITQVLDGTIIQVNIDGKLSEIRYIGIESLMPFQQDKHVEYYSKEAYKKNFELVNGKTVRIEKDVSDADKRGNLLRYVWVDDLMINAELIKQGYAQVIGLPPDLKYYDLFVKLFLEAQNAGRGLWNMKDEMASTAPLPGTFVGNIDSKVYHNSSCKLINMISESSRMFFSSAPSALARGYTPCKFCKPLEKICNQT